MNRSFYIFAIAVTSLLVLVSLFQCTVFFQLGSRTYTLQSFADWYAFSTALGFVGALVLLKYYHFKRYRLAFYTWLVSTVVATITFFITYNVLTGGALAPYYIPAYLITLAFAIISFLTLSFSASGERRWLKLAGLCLAIVHLFVLVLMVWAMSTNSFANPMLEKIHLAASVLIAVTPIFFILNFRDELLLLKNEWRPRSSALEGSMILLCAVGIIGVFVFGSTLRAESSGVVQWEGRDPGNAEIMAQPFEARYFVGSTGDTLCYRFMKPANYDSTTQYPFVVCLHHGGTHGTDNFKQVEGAQAAQVLSANRNTYPAFLFVPQCPKGSGWSGIPALPAIDSLVFECIRALEQEFSVDEKRRYVIGLSGGGYGSWHFISSRPDMFAAAVPICGGADPARAKDIVDVPVWAFHGEDDRAVPVRFTRDMINAIKAAGGNPRYTEFAGAGHNIWENVNATPGLYEWIFAQKRK